MIKKILYNSKILLLFIFVLINLHLYNNDVCYAEKPYLIKFATVAPEGSIWVNYMKELDRKLRSKSKGQIGFRVYAGGIAGDEMDVLKKIRIGQLHCAAFSGVGITEILPEWRVMDLPFLFRNIDEVRATHDEFNKLFNEKFSEKGFEYISWAEVGDVYLFSKREIKTRNDLKGLKMWTWSGDPVSKKTFTIMGSIPISLSITDVTTAINTNMIDTVYAPPVGALAMQWHEKMNYITGIPIAHSTGAILISKEYFDKLPEKLSELFKEEVKISMSLLADELVKQTTESIKIINARGLKISPAPVGDELQRFYELHTEVANELKGDIYPEDLLNKVHNLLDKKRLIQ